MVEWLREVGMPADYVNKLSRMFQDMKVSEDLNSTFKESRRKEATNAGVCVLFLTGKIGGSDWCISFRQ